MKTVLKTQSVHVELNNTIRLKIVSIKLCDYAFMDEVDDSTDV